MKKILLTCLFATVVPNILFAQHRTCGSVHAMQKQIAQDPTMQARLDAIELQTAAYINKFVDKKKRATAVIPVVVHILHNGESVGSGANISQAQVLSQITALNEDFRKVNTDSLPSNHPFQSVTADCEIQFCLATLSPTNAPTSGILRYNINANSISDDDVDLSVKPQTIWDASKYLNIWVCNVTSSGGILGYATAPGGDPSLDGVVILTTAFGYTGNVVAPYDNGRTTVHEVGHWLNLRHIWGDNNCATDFVSDTKPAQDANYGCPTFPHNPNVCAGTDANGEMYMNYMDYVNDACMVMFTKGQKARMLATLNGARASLASSTGCGLNVAIAKPKSSLQYVNIFPNPVKDKMEIQVPISTIAYQISIFDINGKPCKTILQKEINGIVNANIKELAAGMYIVKIRNGSDEVVRKVVVEK
jgi:Pregnancy-associated plasma protein-A/Secretion system C-terminal sorting domain